MKKPQIKLKHRFITKLLISHILIASIPILITGFILIQTSQHAVEKTVKSRNLELAHHFSNNIQMILDNAEKILKYNAYNVISSRQNRLAQELDINMIVNEFPIFQNIVILDDSAHIVMSTSYIENRKKYVAKNFIQWVLNGNEYRSEVYQSEEQLPVIDFAQPCRLYNGNDGILLAEVALKEMRELVESSVIGRNGEAFVFDKYGNYIDHSERKKVYLKLKFNEPAIIQDIANDLNNQRIYVNSEGERMVAGYVSLTRMNWGVVIQQPTNEAFAVAYKMKIQIVWLVVISIILSSFIAFVYTRWIVTPVNQLVSGIDKFSTGDLQYRITSYGMDEISMLAERFNEMAEKLLQLQNRVKKSEQLVTLSKMASVLSHEIKNPLNAMVINMQIMERELNKPEPRLSKFGHYLGIVSSEIQRVDDLVNNFLLVARPPKLDRKRSQINKLVDDLIISQQADALQSGVRVNRNYKDTDIEILIDETKIRQVFLNIMLNAFQAMAGGGNLTIELEVRTENEKYYSTNWVAVSFIDTGKGISKDHIAHIFDYYYSTKSNGTGLGLSVAQQIVEEHGGRIEVASKIGIGSRFTIFLPKESQNI